jgi:Domain of unknown function (DUF4149)
MSTKTGDDKFALPSFPDIGAGGLTTGAGLGRDDSRPTVLHRALHSVRLLLVAVWLGGAVFFSAAVAPSAFAVLPSRELAGALVARTLTILNVGGAVVGLLLLAGAFVGRKGTRLVALLVELLALAAMTGAAFVGHFVIASRMAGLRAQMGKPIEEVAADDALRVAFNALHGQSVTAMSVAIAAAAVALFLVARRTK